MSLKRCDQTVQRPGFRRQCKNRAAPGSRYCECHLRFFARINWSDTLGLKRR